MGKYKLLVLTSAVEGQDKEFNDWYTNQHLGDVVAVPGFSAAQRFKLHSVTMGNLQNKYLAIYEMDAEDPDQAMAALMSRANTDKMPLSSAMDADNVICAVFEVCSNEVVAPKAKAKVDA